MQKAPWKDLNHFKQALGRVKGGQRAKSGGTGRWQRGLRGQRARGDQDAPAGMLGAREQEEIKAHLLVCLGVCGMAGDGSSALEQSTAAGGVNADGGAPARDRLREVGDKLHGVTVKLTRGMGRSGGPWRWVGGG